VRWRTDATRAEAHVDSKFESHIMLRHIKYLLGALVEGSDRTTGKVVDLYFDDHSWAIRWLVVGTGDWLAGRRDISISPITLIADARHAKVMSEPFQSRAGAHKSLCYLYSIVNSSDWWFGHDVLAATHGGLAR